MKSADALERKVKAIASNRKARHDYEIVQVYETGIILQGTEVKSLRHGKCSLLDAYATFTDKNSLELYLVNCHISPYDFGNRENHEPKRQRKLLVNRSEAIKMRNAVNEKGITLIPLSIYFSGRFVKVELGLAKAKRKYDKRETLKERDSDRDIRRTFRV